MKHIQFQLLKFAKITVAMLLFSIAALASAGDGTGPIILLKSATALDGGGMMNVRINGTYNNKPQCTIDTLPTFRMSVETAAGKAILATLLSAQSQGLNVSIFGTGGCDNTQVGGVSREVISAVQVVYP